MQYEMTETMYVETEVDQYLASPEMAILDIFLLSYGNWYLLSLWMLSA